MANELSGSNVPVVLSNRHLAEINRAMAAVDRAAIECDLAERCGNDVGNERTELQEILQALQTYKATYFPSAK